MNKFKENITNQAVKEQDGKIVQTDDAIKKAGDFTFFINKESLNKLMPPLIMGVAVMTVYISLSHFHIKSLREREELRKELSELRSEYISAKSNLMKRSNQSEVAKRLETEGIKELRTPPKIIKGEDKQ
ncbi:MAG: hypothetical protein IT245_00870 [Bacteroidia bacterium]|nr:hypothetical protein [Bacteroidia bacterium]